MRRPVCPHGHQDPSALWRDLKEDAARYLTESLGATTRPHGFVKLLSTLLLPQLLCLLLYRLSHLLHLTGWKHSARFLCGINILWHRATITPASCIIGGCYLPHPHGVVFHGRAGRGLVIYSHGVCTSAGPALISAVEDGPVLGDDVVIGVHASVIGPVVVSSGTNVSFRTDLASDAPPRTIVFTSNLRVSIAPGAAVRP